MVKSLVNIGVGTGSTVSATEYDEAAFSATRRRPNEGEVRGQRDRRGPEQEARRAYWTEEGGRQGWVRVGLLWYI